ncbi:MAG: hypothetical protein IT204_21930 [Fimbriimonadaceae bacterium]|nr:hypothetical protein [Fimbriimonadaceae bacterium]
MKRRVWWLGLLAGVALLAGCEPKKLEPTKSGERTTVLGKTLDRADKSECEQYVGQLNQAVAAYRVSNESNPPDLKTVVKESGLPESVLQNCKINYDPATGLVSLAN